MRKDIHGMPDVPWHVGYVKMAAGDTRRDKRRCVYYQKGNLCPYHDHCIGSSHCSDYKETGSHNQHRVKPPQRHSAKPKPLNPKIKVSKEKRANRGNKILVQDIKTNEKFWISIWREDQLSGIAQNAIGCRQNDIVKYGEYNYKILQISNLE